MSGRWLGWITAVVIGASAVGAQPPSPAGKEGVAEQKERALFKAIAAQIERDYPVLPDAALSQYLAAVTAPLAQAAGLQAQVTIKVVDSSRPLASALPGGIVYVGAGLLAGADGAVVANVLALEIAHIAARHGTMQRSAVSTQATIPVIFMGGSVGVCSTYGERSLQVPAALLRQQAGYEEEADALGQEYVRKAGYDVSPPQAPPPVPVRQKGEKPPTLRRPSEAASKP